MARALRMLSGVIEPRCREQIWCLSGTLWLMGGSGIGDSGDKVVVAEKVKENGSKGKSVKEVIDLDVDGELFMETEDRKIEQVQAGGNRKRIRS
ncbi:hypothetical protein C1H46_032380 [Malus baccata]|uniref:Uncharacterized protein n=1 Tax=Malus baccata TaxID=106549 RepID=A0A540L6G2_MALBA|nr:hypothetical protein C1H46_032380 [Malus baccata]